MLKVGITGGIGSGKSTVAKIFLLLGIPVYNADDAAKELMRSNPEIKAKIIAAFGPESYTQQELNRSYLSGAVFNNAKKIELLNSIVHPAVIEHAKWWMNQQTAPYTLKEAALLFESGSHADLDVVIGVSTPEPLRLLRAMQRDNAEKNTIKSRMDKQLDEKIKMQMCDYLIFNNDQQLVIPQVIQLHHILLQKAKEKKG